jgi:hypothetical protein
MVASCLLWLLLCHGVASWCRGIMLTVGKAGWDEGGSYSLRCNNKKTMMNDNIVIVHCLVATSLPVKWHLGPMFVVVAWS